MSMSIEIVTEASAHMKPGFSPCGSVCLISNRSPKMLRHISRPCVLQNCQFFPYFTGIQLIMHFSTEYILEA
jgi:hypothetical protein